MFLIDSILIGQRMHLGYLIMRHMILCAETPLRILLYGCFLTLVFKKAGIVLSRERDNMITPSPYDTFVGRASLLRMRLVLRDNGT